MLRDRKVCFRARLDRKRRRAGEGARLASLGSVGGFRRKPKASEWCLLPRQIVERVKEEERGRRGRRANRGRASCGYQYLISRCEESCGGDQDTPDEPPRARDGNTTGLWVAMVVPCGTVTTSPMAAVVSSACACAKKGQEALVRACAGYDR